MTLQHPSPDAKTTAYTYLDCLRILVIGSTSRVCSALEQAGHIVLPVPDFEQAAEALLVQRFDAVLVAPDSGAGGASEFVAKLKELDLQHAGTRMPVLSVIAEGKRTAPTEPESDMFDGTVQESLDPDALTLAIARLASAVSLDKGFSKAAPLDPELPILEVEALKEQVAFDSELLIELIDLYFSERSKQSVEMAQALASGDYDLLSRVAHTIKGSLGSLHATSSRMTAQALEVAARDSDAEACRDLLPAFEVKLDLLQVELASLRDSLSAP